VTDAVEPVGEELVLANEHVRVWTEAIAPGHQQNVHTHRTPYLSVMVTGGRAQVLTADGEVLYDVDRPAGAATWFGPDGLPVTHTLRNIGDTEIRVVVVEVLGGAS
jgi:beta-alanine degradation protein BauB